MKNNLYKSLSSFNYQRLHTKTWSRIDFFKITARNFQFYFAGNWCNSVGTMSCPLLQTNLNLQNPLSLFLVLRLCLQQSILLQQCYSFYCSGKRVRILGSFLLCDIFQELKVLNLFFLSFSSSIFDFLHKIQLLSPQKEQFLSCSL